MWRARWSTLRMRGPSGSASPRRRRLGPRRGASTARQWAGVGSTWGKVTLNNLTKRSTNLLNPRYVSTLEKIGFPEMYAVAALRQTDNDINASMDLIQDKPGEKQYNLFTFSLLGNESIQINPSQNFDWKLISIKQVVNVWFCSNMENELKRGGKCQYLAKNL